MVPKGIGYLRNSVAKSNLGVGLLKQISNNSDRGCLTRIMVCPCDYATRIDDMSCYLMIIAYTYTSGC